MSDEVNSDAMTNEGAPSTLAEIIASAPHHDPGTVLPGSPATDAAPCADCDEKRIASMLAGLEVYGGDGLSEEQITAMFLWQTEKPHMVKAGQILLERLNERKNNPPKNTFAEEQKAAGHFVMEF